ncbi:MAG: hypothetical protein KAJ14_02640, partial [Candidatus Omnitrophica bacterium]|nr:hypothetical protein [Candidatus Omnitrophota bacterium]
MELNWTVEILVLIISSFFISFASIIAFAHYLKTRHKTFLFFMLSWLNISLFAFFEALSYLFLSIPLFRFRFYFLILGGFFLIFALDSISRFSIDPFKTTIFGILSTLLIVFSYLPDAIIPYTFKNGDKSFSTQGPLVIIGSVVFALIGVVFVIYCVDLYISSPTDIKKWSRLTLIGALIFGLLPTIFYA